MNRLSDRSYWDLVHIHQASDRKTGLPSKKLHLLAKSILGERCLRYYSDYLLWDVILPRHLPKQKGLKVLEVGSAPGDTLVRLKETFGYIPYGVEYSQPGAELNRRKFIEHNINPSNVIQADFFSPEFQDKYRGYFDIVLSSGFIEHFTNVEDVIRGHINVLAKGGHLVVIIPNLRGINYFLGYVFNRKVLPMHNMTIMRKKEFRWLFNAELMECKLCDYFGTFDFGVFNTPEGSPLRFLLGFCKMWQAIFNAAFPRLFGDKGAESSFFSPYLIFIGVKKK
ncbi:MAG: class I SAM-dependent methyltransferase [Planctomycetota bacterium]